MGINDCVRCNRLLYYADWFDGWISTINLRCSIKNWTVWQVTSTYITKSPCSLNSATTLIKWCDLLDSNQLPAFFKRMWAPASPKSHKIFDNVYGWLTHFTQCKVVGLWTRYTSSMCRKILETKTHTLSKMVGMVGLEPTEFSFWMKHGYPVTSHAHKIFCRLTWR